MKENQEKNLDLEDQTKADVGNDINSNYEKLRKNKIIIASIILVGCLLIFIFIFSKDSNKKKEEIKIEQTLKNKKDTAKNNDADIGGGDSINDLGIEVTKSNIIEEEKEDLSLKIPPLPELKIEIPSIKIEDNQENNKKEDKEIIEEFESMSGFNNTYDDIIVQNGKQIKKEKKEEVEKKSNIILKKPDNVVTDPRKTPIILYGDSTGSSHPDSSMIHENNIVIVGEDDISKIKEKSTDIATKIVKNRDNVIAQGKKINAILETAIDTEVPGFVRAIISRDVYPEQGNKVLIPRGSRIYGSYEKNIQRGQGRVNISWTRLIRPDGVEVSIDFTASDEFGKAGIKGNVDNKYGNIVKNSILSSILAIGSGAVADLISDDTTTVANGSGISYVTSSAASTITKDISGKLIDVVKSKIDSFDDTPIIRIPQGTKITIIVQGDMEMPHMQNY